MSSKLLLEHRRKCQYRKRILFYLKQKHLTQRAWCRQHDLDPYQLNKILNLIERPSTNWAYAIAQATDGTVPAIHTLIESDFIAQDLWKTTRPRAQAHEVRFIAKAKSKPKPRIRRKQLNTLDPFKNNA